MEFTLDFPTEEMVNIERKKCKWVIEKSIITRKDNHIVRVIHERVTLEFIARRGWLAFPQLRIE